MTAPAVYGAICDVMAEVAHEGISKDRKNTQQGYNFRGIDDVYNALCPILAKHRLAILPRLASVERAERKSNSGGLLYLTYVTVDFDFVSAVDGSKHTITAPGEAMDSADKSTNKAMSAAYKYACMQAFSIPTEGDNDADATTHYTTPSAPQSPMPARTTAPAGAGAKLHEKYSLVWFLYANSSVVGQHVSKIPPEKLTSYISRLEGTMKGKDQPNAVEAQWYYQAALREHDARMAFEGAKEAPKSGASAAS